MKSLILPKEWAAGLFKHFTFKLSHMKSFHAKDDWTFHAVYEENVHGNRLLSSRFSKGTIYFEIRDHGMEKYFGPTIKWGSSGSTEHGITANCAIAAIGGWYLGYGDELYWNDILNVIEAYYRFCGRSILLASDEKGGVVSNFLDKAPGWQRTAWTQNQNYPDRDHKVCMYYKYIGEYEYPRWKFEGIQLPVSEEEQDNQEEDDYDEDDNRE